MEDLPEQGVRTTALFMASDGVKRPILILILLRFLSGTIGSRRGGRGPHSHWEVHHKQIPPRYREWRRGPWGKGEKERNVEESFPHGGQRTKTVKLTKDKYGIQLNINIVPGYEVKIRFIQFFVDEIA